MSGLSKKVSRSLSKASRTLSVDTVCELDEPSRTCFIKSR